MPKPDTNGKLAAHYAAKRKRKNDSDIDYKSDSSSSSYYPSDEETKPKAKKRKISTDNRTARKASRASSFGVGRKTGSVMACNSSHDTKTDDNPSKNQSDLQTVYAASNPKVWKNLNKKQKSVARKRITAILDHQPMPQHMNSMARSPIEIRKKLALCSKEPAEWQRLHYNEKSRLRQLWGNHFKNTPLPTHMQPNQKKDHKVKSLTEGDWRKMARNLQYAYRKSWQDNFPAEPMPDFMKPKDTTQETRNKLEQYAKNPDSWKLLTSKQKLNSRSSWERHFGNKPLPGHMKATPSSMLEKHSLYSNNPDIWNALSPLQKRNHRNKLKQRYPNQKLAPHMEAKQYSQSKPRTSSHPVHESNVSRHKRNNSDSSVSLVAV